MNNRLVMLTILDGLGINENEKANAVKLANTPNLDKLSKQNPTTIIKTSGLAVGLPEGQMGNSEVGHTNIGAGRVVYQELTRITNEIENGDFFSNTDLVNAIEYCKQNNKKLHIMGLLSNGGVHSHTRHLYALLELAKRRGFEEVYIHCFLDGRDTPPASAENYIIELEKKIKEKQIGQIATIIGRFYAMDRDKRWERVKKAYDALVYGIGEKHKTSQTAIESSYQKETFDEFVEPAIICSDDSPVGIISEGDGIIFYNFRPDRAREITRALVDPDFSEFEVKRIDPYYVCFTEYDKTIPNVYVAFKPKKLENTLGEYLSKSGLKQLRIAETEKYAHVTFFIDGGEEKVYEGEDRILVPSPKVQTYDMKPEMSALEITDNVIDAINSGKYDLIVLNYANPDMVGHTGNLEATIKAIEVIDECLGKVVKVIEEKNGIMIVTADHGNAEEMIDYQTGEPHTAHTTNPVPLILKGVENVTLREGKLADLAPTILELLKLTIPKEMTGTSLINKEG